MDNMRMRNKRSLIIVIVALVLVLTTGCNNPLTKLKKDKPVSGTATQVQRPTSLGQYQDMISVYAAKLIAKEYNIDISEEAIDTFIANTVGEEPETPTQLLDINNNPQVIKTLIGDAGYRSSFIAPYVEEKLGKVLEDKYADVSEEDIQTALKDYKEYLDSLGIQEDAREEYVTYILSLESMTMEIDQIYYDAYARATEALLQQLEPEYYGTLDLK